eukprot:15380734-Alexandrium_andersonii.AAC.1
MPSPLAHLGCQGCRESAVICIVPARRPRRFILLDTDWRSALKTFAHQDSTTMTQCAPNAAVACRKQLQAVWGCLLGSVRRSSALFGRIRRFRAKADSV